MSVPTLTSLLSKVSDTWFDDDATPLSVTPSSLASEMGLSVQDVDIPPLFGDLVTSGEALSVQRLVVNSSSPPEGQVWLLFSETPGRKVFSGLGFTPNITVTKASVVVNFDSTGLQFYCVLADGNLGSGTDTLPFEIEVSLSDVSLTLRELDSAKAPSAQAWFNNLLSPANSLTLPLLQNATLKSLRLRYDRASKSVNFSLDIHEQCQIFSKHFTLTDVSISADCTGGSLEDLTLSASMVLEAGPTTQILWVISASYYKSGGWAFSAAMAGSSVSNSDGKPDDNASPSLQALMSTLGAGHITLHPTLENIVIKNASLGITPSSGEFSLNCTVRCKIGSHDDSGAVLTLHRHRTTSPTGAAYNASIAVQCDLTADEIVNLFGVTPSLPFQMDVTSLNLSYDSASKDWSTGCAGTLALEDDGTSMKFDIEFIKSDSGKSFELTLAGLTFKEASVAGGLSVLSFTGSETLHLSDLARLLRLQALESPDFDPSFTIKDAFLAYTSESHSKKLFGLQFSFEDAKLDDSIIHFVTGGGSLGISGATFLAATDPWTATEVQAISGNVGSIILPSEVRKGPSFTATLAVGGDTVSSPLTPSGQQPPGPPAPPAGSTAPPPTPIAVTSSSATRWFEVQKKVGPLTLARAGVAMGGKTSDGKPKVDVLLDASFLLGPITITLDQFELGIPIEWPLVIGDFDISLHGLQITFDKAPLLISGGLLHTTDKAGYDMYMGDVIIHTEALSLTALGEYAKMADGTTSLALLAVLNDPPLGGPAFCFVTGLAAGFGYNNVVNLPTTIATLPGCPIIQALDPVNDIDLEALKTTLVPTRGHDWLAVGLLFRSFEMIQSSALLIAQFGGGDLKLSLLAQSELSIPPNSAERLAYAQLDVEATFDLGTGSLTVLGVLTDKSYVIAPECKLSGGFAFLVNEQGDFLATFGGYSPDFDYASRGYPAVPRLGIQWQIDSHTAIKGQEYFAITPECMMAGGSLQATWDCGIFSAWFNFDAHLFIQWRPLLYSVGFSMDLGVAFDLKVLFVHIHFNFHIGASIQIDGPPFHGKAHIDLDVISFTVEFGSAAPQPVLPWADFRRLLPGSVKLDAAALTKLSTPDLTQLLKAAVTKYGTQASAALIAAAALTDAKALSTALTKLGAADLSQIEDAATTTLDSTASPLLSAKVTGGLVKDLSQPKAKTHPDDPDWIINGTEFALHISSAVPLTSINDDSTNCQQPTLGILPMRDASNATANHISKSELSITLSDSEGKVTITPLDSILSTALWGQEASTDVNAPQTLCTSSLHFCAAEMPPKTICHIPVSALVFDPTKPVSVRPRTRATS